MGTPVTSTTTRSRSKKTSGCLRRPPKDYTIWNLTTPAWSRRRTLTELSSSRCATSTPMPPHSLTSAGQSWKIWTQCHTDGTGQKRTAQAAQISHLSTTITPRATSILPVTAMTTRTQTSSSHPERYTHMITTATITEPDDNKHHEAVIDEAKSFFIERLDSDPSEATCIIILKPKKK